MTILTPTVVRVVQWRVPARPYPAGGPAIAVPTGVVPLSWRTGHEPQEGAR